jgi:hypothetical protein
VPPPPSSDAVIIDAAGYLSTQTGEAQWQVGEGGGSSDGQPGHDDRSFGAAGTLTIREGRGVAWVDFRYSRPFATYPHGRLAAAELILDAQIGLRAVDTGRIRCDLLGGVRIVNVRASIVPAAEPRAAGSLDSGNTWGNGVVGIRAGVGLASGVWLNGQADVGGQFPDSLGSNFTWQAGGGAEWRAGAAYALILEYRVLALRHHVSNVHSETTRHALFAGVRYTVRRGP